MDFNGFFFLDFWIGLCLASFWTDHTKTSILVVIASTTVWLCFVLPLSPALIFQWMWFPVESKGNTFSVFAHSVFPKFLQHVRLFTLFYYDKSRIPPLTSIRVSLHSLYILIVYQRDKVTNKKISSVQCTQFSFDKILLAEWVVNVIFTFSIFVNEYCSVPISAHVEN